MLEWKWVHFSVILPEQLYDVMQLREQVFSLEQQVTCEDLDGLDKQAYHLLGFNDGEMVAYARVLPLGVYAEGVVSLGRLLIVKKLRGCGYGKALMQEVLRFIAEKYPQMTIKFSAQLYLRKFYAEFGFQAYGDVYLEGGIEHIAMTRCVESTLSVKSG